MKHFLPLFLGLFLAQATLHAQAVSINTDGSAPAASAILDVKSSDKGMLVPRMTTAQRTAIATPAAGLLVYDTTTGDFWFYTGTAWKNLSTQKVLADADGNTIVQVEKNPNEDIIRFDLAGTESMVLRKNTDGTPRLDFSGINTFVGGNAGGANTTGNQNTAFGRSALSSNTTGGTNTAIGFQALTSNTNGSQNTATGRSAMLFNTGGNNNTANGYGSLFSNVSGGSNTASGANALLNNTTGFSNTANGVQALFGNTTGSNNTANGYFALASTTTGNNNTALGYLADVTSGALTNATAIGYNAKVGASNSLVLGGTGADAVIVGVGTTTPAASAVLDLTSTSKGMLVPRMTSAQRTAIALPATGLLVFDTDSGGFWFYNGTAWTNLSSPNILQDADNNTKVQVEKNPNEDIIRFDLAGTESMVLQKNAGGSPRLELLNALDNTFVGKNTGSANTTGNFNTAFGANSLNVNTSGFGNVALGESAMTGNTTGSNNVCVGTNSNVGSGTLSNATAIGRTTTVNASNKVRLGNSIVTVIEGQVDWTFPSDARFKFNIHDDKVPGLAFIEKLRPVTYQFDTRKFDEHLMQNMPDSIRRRRMEGQDYRASSATLQTGFLAQEVEAVCKKLGYEFSGLHVPQSESDNYGLAYGSFVPLLVKAVQEQQTEIGNLNAKVQQLQSQLTEMDDLKTRLARLEAALGSTKSEPQTTEKK